MGSNESQPGIGAERTRRANETDSIAGDFQLTRCHAVPNSSSMLISKSVCVFEQIGICRQVSRAQHSGEPGGNWSGVNNESFLSHLRDIH